MPLTTNIERTGASIEWRAPYHTLGFYIAGPWEWRCIISRRGMSVVVGNMQLMLHNRARTSEMQLALERKRHGDTDAERRRGWADFTLLSGIADDDEKAAARAYLDQVDQCQ